MRRVIIAFTIKTGASPDNGVRLKMNLNRYVINYIKSAFIIFVAVGIIVGLGYIKTEEKITDAKTTETLDSMEQVCGFINSSITNSIMRILNLMDDKEIARLSYIEAEYEPSDYVALIEAKKRIVQYSVTDNLVDDCVLFYEKPNPTMITTRYIVTDPETHYDSGMMRFGDYDYVDFKALLNRPDMKSVGGFYMPDTKIMFHPGAQGNYIIYCLYSAASLNAYQPTALLSVSTERVKSMLNPFLSGTMGFIVMTDNFDNILYQENHTNDANAIASFKPAAYEGNRGFKKTRDGIVFYIKSQYSKAFNYYIYVPNTLVKGQIRPMFVSLLLFYAVALVVGVVFYVIIAWVKEKPLFMLIDKLHSTNRDMLDRISTMEALSVSGVMERLLKGGIVGDDELEHYPNILEHIPAAFRVCVIQWKKYPDAEENSFLLDTAYDCENAINRYFKNPLLHRYDLQTLAFVIDDGSYEHERVEDMIGEIIYEITDKYNLLVSVAIGNRYEFPGDGRDALYYSCSEAYNCVGKIKDWQVKRIYWFEHRNRVQVYEISYEYLNRLSLYITNGDVASLGRLLLMLYERNFSVQGFHLDDCLSWYNDLYSVLNRCSLEMPIGDLLKEVPPFKDMAEPKVIYDSFADIMTRAAQTAQNQKNKVAENFKDSLLSFVDQNYANPNLSLKLLSKEFNMSEKYVSLFFKTNMGDKLSEYIENKRMEEAVRLITETKKPITEIQLAVGYSSPNTFYKAFRRKFGVSPSVWREQNNDAPGK